MKIIEAIEFASFSADHLELWSKLEGANINHSLYGAGEIVRVEQRVDYIPLIYIRFENSNQHRIFNSDSFKSGAIQTIQLSKDLNSLIHNLEENPIETDQEIPESEFNDTISTNTESMPIRTNNISRQKKASRQMNDYLWSDNPHNRLQAAKHITDVEGAALLREFCSISPIQPWPFGMPTSINPLVVIIGVSPGNSPSPNDKGYDTFAFDPPTIGEPHKGFFYPDSRGYWEKTRELCIGFVRHMGDYLSDNDCLALSGHLNLGTGMFGKAGPEAIEDDLVSWVSTMLYSRLKPRIIVLFGLYDIFQKNKYQRLWNISTGLQVNWQKAQNEIKLKDSRYKFRHWSSRRSDNKPISLLMWPNHPSRPPFNNRTIWTDSINQGIEILSQLNIE